MDCINPFKEKIEVKLKKEKLLVRALESIFLVSVQPSKIYMDKKNGGAYKCAQYLKTLAQRSQIFSGLLTNLLKFMQSAALSEAELRQEQRSAAGSRRRKTMGAY